MLILAHALHIAVAYPYTTYLPLNWYPIHFQFSSSAELPTKIVNNDVTNP